MVEFLELLPEVGIYIFELRDLSWFSADVNTVLQDHSAAFCINDIDRRTSQKEATADFIYIRLPRTEEAYQGKYSSGQLSGRAGAISTWVQGGKKVYGYFDYDQHGNAPQNALELKEMLDA